MLRKTIAALVAVAILALAILAGPHPMVALANQSAHSAYCTPPNNIVNGTPVDAPPVQQNFGHAEVCGGQDGDLFSDGPLFDPTFSFSGSSLAFVIPANVWVALGQRVYTSASLHTAPANTTSYWWVDASSGAILETTSNSPPTLTSVLEYTIIANGAGITSVTPAARAAVVFYQATISNLTNGDCVQAGSGGLLTSASGGCGTGSGGTTIVPGNCISASPTASPTAGAEVVSVTPPPGSNCTLQAAASGVTPPTATAGSVSSSIAGSEGELYLGDSTAAGTIDFGATTSGKFTASAQINAPNLLDSGLTPGDCVQAGTGGLLTSASAACGSGGGTFVNLLASPNPTSSPNNTQNGYAAIKGMFLDCKGAIGTGTPPPGDCSSMLVYQNSIVGGGCENQYYNTFGTSAQTQQGVEANLFAWGCANIPDTAQIAAGEDTSSRADVRNYSLGLYGDIRPGGSLYFADQRGIEFADASNLISPCRLAPTSPTGAGVSYGHATTGSCGWQFADVAPNSTLCTSSTSYVGACASPSPAPVYAFPWDLKQAGSLSKNSSGTSVSGTFGSTATSGDFLLAIIFFNCNTGSTTIATPVGWSLFGTGLECDTTNSEAIQVFEKTSNGTETGISATASSATISNVYLYEFAGARTPDKFAGTAATSSNSLVLPSLTSPTSGAGVIVACQTATGGTFNGMAVYPRGVHEWSSSFTNYNTGNGAMTVGFYQGVIGSTFFTPQCGPFISLNLVPLAGVTLSLL